MRERGAPQRTIWRDGDDVCIIDQTLLPHRLAVARLKSMEDAHRAIADMQVRGAPLIGATAAYGLALALQANPGLDNLARSRKRLAAARPTAVNLRWALQRIANAVEGLKKNQRAESAWREAETLCEEDVAICSAIGDHGLELLVSASQHRSGGTVNVLTHCNAGWLATIEWGTALAPVYKAHAAGIDVHVWVDETRPRNQGSSLTAWELAAAGVPHTVVADNAGGRLMQLGEVDLCLVGTDRTTASGDVCNKIGTYLKALAAADNQVPFYVCVPSPSIDWELTDNPGAIPVETRPPEEMTHVTGLNRNGELETVAVVHRQSRVRNDAFDITPARLVTGLVTERGVCDANPASLASRFPELARVSRVS